MANVFLHPSSQEQEVLLLKLECAVAPIEVVKVGDGSLVDNWQPGIRGVALCFELTCADSQVVPAEYKAISEAPPKSTRQTSTKVT